MRIWRRPKPATATPAATVPNLSAYNSAESAADFADLRKVLGFDVWNVYGTSYGSYVAQTLMRDHPEGIRSVVLDLVSPTTYNVAANWQNASDAFGNIFQACAAEASCNAAHPGLEQTFTGLVNKLEAEPLMATVRDPATGEDIKVVIDGGALVDWLRNQNYGVPMLQVRRIASMGSLSAAPTLSRRLPWIGLVAHHHPIRPRPLSVMGSPFGS